MISKQEMEARKAEREKRYRAQLRAEMRERYNAKRRKVRGADLDTRQSRDRARSTALNELRRRHPAAFEVLFRAECDKWGVYDITPGPKREKVRSRARSAALGKFRHIYDSEFRDIYLRICEERGVDNTKFWNGTEVAGGFVDEPEEGQP